MNSLKELQVVEDGALSRMKETKIEQVEILQHVMSPQGLIQVEPFVRSTHHCQWCDEKDHVTFMEGKNKCWICINAHCVVNTTKKTVTTTKGTIPYRRALEWPLFCELNDLGDLMHKVNFESIEQSPQKIDYMRKFVSDPSGLIWMEGKYGTGKTYAALGMCELFTRRDNSCIFATQTQMLNKWYINLHKREFCDYGKKLTDVKLLVIDDVGSSTPSPYLLDFFRDMINTRLQWSNRGTVITTNLDVQSFYSFCGVALADRIKTGQCFEFTGASRRKPNLIR